MTSTSRKKLLRVLDGEGISPRPVWLMRQAGRYLPEYRELRSRSSSFLEFCYSPAMACEATLQPIRRFGFDAAILFSDILVIPDALGQEVTFETGEGPRLDAIVDRNGVDALRSTLDQGKIGAVLETIDRIKGQLTTDTALIGFCGAPWTVASYMIAGRGTSDQGPARRFAYAQPQLFAQLIARLVDASVDYLVAQFRAGVDVVQIFDSWAGVLPALEYEAWCLRPVLEIVRRVRLEIVDARIIVFSRGAPSHMTSFSGVPGVAALGLDTAVNPAWAAKALPASVVLQGNIDPLVLVAGGAALEAAIDHLLGALKGRPHIVNLGHGIVPETPVAHVQQLIDRVRREN